MSISHVASAASGSTTNTTSLTITIPAGTLADDILIAAFSNRDATANPSVTDDDTGGNAWAILGGSGTGGTVWWKRATSGTASRTITATGFTGSCAGGVSVYRGASRETIPYENVTAESNASGNEAQAGFSPTRNGALVVLAVFNRTNDIAVSGQSSTSPGALNERFDHLNTGGSDCSVALASAVQATAGATGNLTWAQTNATTLSIGFDLLPENQGTLAATLDAVTASAAGALPLEGAASVTLGAVTLAASGRGPPVLGAATITLADVTAATTGALVLQGMASVVLDATALSAEATVTGAIGEPPPSPVMGGGDAWTRQGFARVRRALRRRKQRLHDIASDVADRAPTQVAPRLRPLIHEIDDAPDVFALTRIEAVLAAIHAETQRQRLEAENEERDDEELLLLAA